MRLFKPGGIEALHGVSAERIVEICRVHLTTARRWKRGEEPPFTALELIQLHEGGELGVVDLKWAGWRMRGGKLISDDRASEFTPGEVRAIPFMKMQIASYHRDQRLPRQGDWIAGQWMPALDQSAVG